MDTKQLRERFLRDSLPMQLGGLASDLARVASFADQPAAHRQLVANVLQESKCFAEWAAIEAPKDIQVALADTQGAVVRWSSAWRKGAPPATMQTEAERRAEELLKLAGLI